MFNAPIPGQSLTSEPKNYPWENPPEFPAPEDALMWHMDRLQEPKRVKALLGTLELGLDVVTLTEGILRLAVADGRHSIDVSLIIAPVIHEYIVGTAEAAGVEYKEGLEEDFNEEEMMYSVEKSKVRKILGDVEDDKEVDLEPLMEEPEDMEQVEGQTEDMPKEEPVGLMARRT